jgi:glycosyltransferase involved in cell wall biosynthesis
MKIGLVIYGSLDTLSGGYLYDRKLVDYLRAQGDAVEVISLPWRNYAAHLTDNLHFRLPAGLRTLVRQTTRPKRTEVRAPDRSPFDILIQDELNHPSLIAANTARHRYPVISLVHHLRCSELRPKWQNDFYRLVEKRYLNSVDGFIFNSETTQRVVRRLVESSKPEIVAYPPTDRFGEGVTENEILERAKIPELRILFLGNVIERKGLHTLLDALAVGRDNISPYKLDVVGSLTIDPAYANAIREKITANGLSTFIFLHGPLDNSPLKEKLRQAHVLVVPSSYEGFGIVYLEGMGFGLPAIGTTAGAAGEIIEDGKTGYLIEPNDAATLAARLASLAQDRELLTRLSVNALQRYRVQPTWEQTAKNIREFLLSVTVNRGAVEQSPCGAGIASSGKEPSSQ